MLGDAQVLAVASVVPELLLEEVGRESADVLGVMALDDCSLATSLLDCFLWLNWSVVVIDDALWLVDDHRRVWLFICWLSLSMMEVGWSLFCIGFIWSVLELSVVNQSTD